MSERASRGGTDWAVVWIAFGAGIVAATHIGKLPPALPEIRLALEADLVTGGWIASLISCTGFALGLVAGSFADRLGVRRVLIASLCAMAAGSLLGAAAQTAEIMLVARFIEGIGFTGATITGAAVIVGATGAGDRKWALGVWSSYLPLGFAGAMLAGAAILPSTGWRFLWILDAVVTLIWAGLFVYVTRGSDIPRGQAAPRTPLLRNVSLTLKRTGAVLAAACFALYAAQHISMMNWLPTYMQEARGAGVIAGASIPALVLLSNAGGNWLSARLMGRGLANWKLLSLGALGMGLTEIGIFSAAVPDALRLALALAFGVFGGMIPAAAIGSVAVYTPSPGQVATMNGLMVTGTNTGQLFGPPALAAARQSAGSWEGTLWLVLCLAAAGLALGLASRAFERRAQIG